MVFKSSLIDVEIAEEVGISPYDKAPNSERYVALILCQHASKSVSKTEVVMSELCQCSGRLNSHLSWSIKAGKSVTKSLRRYS